MPESPAEFFDITPGAVSRVDSSMSLPAFEDAVALQLRPRLNIYQWEIRPALKDFLRPPGFNGMLSNIVLESLRDPLGELKDAKAQGRTVTSEPGGKTTKYANGEPTESQRRNVVACFALSAVARSTSGGIVGPIASKIWYGPQAIRLEDAILRLVAAPDYDPAAFERFRPRRARPHRVGRAALPSRLIPNDIQQGPVYN